MTASLSEMSNRGIDLLRNDSEPKWAAEKDIIDPPGKVDSRGVKKWR